MGLFNKDPAEKKLKELTGGMFLNSSFKDKLAKAGLSDADGFIIQRELKTSIKSGEIEVEGEDREDKDQTPKEHVLHLYSPKPHLRVYSP